MDFEKRAREIAYSLDLDERLSEAHHDALIKRIATFAHGVYEAAAGEMRKRAAKEASGWGNEAAARAIRALPLHPEQEKAG